MGYLDKTGLTYFYTKLKSLFASTLSVSGRTVTLKSKSGATLSSITTQDTTYDVVSTSANGLCPKRGGTSTKFLRDDGTWAVPPDTDTTYSAATTSAAGLMSASDKTKLNGVSTGATKNSIVTNTVTLTVAGWSSNSQVVTVSGVTTSNLVIVEPSDSSYGIKCTAQGTNSLTFTCDTVPTAAVTVKVAIIT